MAKIKEYGPANSLGGTEPNPWPPCRRFCAARSSWPNRSQPKVPTKCDALEMIVEAVAMGAGGNG